MDVLFKVYIDVSGCLALPILSTPKICGIPRESRLLFLTSPKGLEIFLLSRQSTLTSNFRSCQNKSVVVVISLPVSSGSFVYK